MEKAYERLTALDQSFLHFETPNTYMHVALTAIFDPGSLGTSEGGIDIERLRCHIASRLTLIPRYRQRLSYIPVLGEPVWVDDATFELAYHVRHVNLPRPGGERQLQRLVAEILERPLDRCKPLWETWFIEGLEGGRFAMLSKVHHCMVDGIAGVDLLAALLAVAPFEQTDAPQEWSPRQPPSGTEMLRDDIARRARAAVRLASRVPNLMRDDGEMSAVRRRVGAMWDLLSSGLQGAADTPLNQPVGPHRRIDWLRLDLSEMKEIKNRCGGSLNDVVLATVAGAVGGFLAQRGIDIADLDFRALVPVNTRSRDAGTVAGNHVSAWLTPLPIAEHDALERMRTIQQTTAGYKESEQSLGAEMLTETAEWTTSLVLGIAVRLLNQSRPYNMIVTNVPGPPVPFYLLDAPMIAAYPHVPLFENQGLGIALFSYAGSLYWGFAGDWDLVPDLSRFRELIVASFEQLRTAAGIQPSRKVRTLTPRPRPNRVA